DLKRHSLTHIDENDPELAALKRPHCCDICGRSFSIISNMENHKKTHFGNINPEEAVLKCPFKCEKCGE
ncbi:hypothetical protein PMAYCL1PPCAC_08099, partial [Pristionchus mayeri]